jgi:uncharacterized protein with ParB-like and HNH nuclease domain
MATNIGEVMEEINNYYNYDYESDSYEFVALTKKITGTFANTYLVGQYIRIYGSILNDDVYKIAVVAEGEITVEEDLIDESVVDSTIYILVLAPPRSLIALVADIANYIPKDGIASESIDNYSVSFSGDGSWIKAFGKRLSKHRKIRWCNPWL